MIPFVFDYYQPETLDEAAGIYQQLERAGKSPVFFGGGTELISMARVGTRQMGAVVDIKRIKECGVLERQDGALVIGAGVTLSAITESNMYPLLGQTAARIADHTMQCKITLGGNVCGTIQYREAVLPLLLSDSTAVICGGYGLREVHLKETFSQRMLLQPDEFIAQFKINAEYLRLPFLHVKKVKMEKIDYPLITLCAIKKDGHISMAFSGLCAFPFRSVHMEAALNDRTASPAERIQTAGSMLPAPPANDLWGSGEYRLFVLKNMLEDALVQL